MSAPGMDAEAAAAAAEVEREERHRLAVLATSVPMLLLLAPVALPLVEEQSMLELSRREPGVLFILVAIFFWPLLVGALSLRRALQRQAPSTVAFTVPAVFHIMVAGLTALYLLMIAAGTSARSRQSTGIWTAIALALATVYVIARGFRRRGWERWAQVVAGMWIGYSAFALLLWEEGRGVLDPPFVGGFVLLFALSMAAPAVGWILWPRRRP